MADANQKSFQSIRAKVNQGGRIIIPMEIRNYLGLHAGQDIVFVQEVNGFRVTTLEQAIQDVQDYFVNLAPPGVSMSDELIQLRREEAAKEDLG